MATLRTAHTASLTAGDRAAIRALLDVAFAGDFSEHDQEHALGGIHALVTVEGTLVAHASVVMRRLLHDGRALRTGYVEAVGVHPDHRRRGHGAAVMTVVEEVIRGAYELGALGATDDGAALYRSRGWQPWTGTASVLAPDGPRPTPDDARSILVLPVSAALRPDGDLACDWREGDVW